MSIAEQAIFDSFGGDIYEYRFPDTTHHDTDTMNFSVENTVTEEESLESVWKAHQNLVEDHHRANAAGSVTLELPETQLLGALSQGAATRRGSVTFINPFLQEGENGASQLVQEAVSPNTTISPSNSATCDHEEALEESDRIYPTWGQFSNASLGSAYVSMPRYSHHNILEGVYQDINQQIGRRFSALPSYEHQIQAVAPSSIQFVIEDPSGKENHSASSNVEFSGRRHSVSSPHLYCCPWPGCNKVFNRFYNLRSHYRIHSGEKPFTCNFCDASFARNHDLKRHERIHSNSKPFVCTICNKAFSRNDAMNRHVRLNSCSKNS